MAGGGTWTILVKEGETTTATQSTIAGGQTKGTRPAVDKNGSANSSRTGRQLVHKGIVFGTVIAKAGFNQYYSVTGQSARRNQMNATLGYGAAVLSIGVQLSTGNIVGAAVTAVGTTVALGNQYVSFQRDVTDQNATAEYLRQQSGTSISSNRGELFNFSLF